MNEDLEFKDIDEDDEEEVKIPEIHGTKNYMTRACYNRLLDERKNLVLGVTGKRARLNITRLKRTGNHSISPRRYRVSFSSEVRT